MSDESQPPVRGRESVYESLLEMSTDPLYAVADGTVTVVNEALVDLTGYERAALVGIDVGTLVHEESLPEWQHQTELLQRSGDTQSERLSGRLVSKSGSEIPVECQLSLLDDGTESELIVGRVRDLREEKQQEKKLEVLNRALRHNIRNEMNLVVGKASRLQQIDDEGYRTAAAKIEEVGKRVINLSEKARRAQEHITIPADEECRLELVEATEHVITTFEIAIQELLENAVIHHTAGNGSVLVEIDGDDQTVEIRIKDECEPIPDQIQQTLNKASEEPLQHNDGLGLWIVNWTVETVDGELTFGSRSDDSGNVVTITFDTIPDTSV